MDSYKNVIIQDQQKSTDSNNDEIKYVKEKTIQIISQKCMDLQETEHAEVVLIELSQACQKATFNYDNVFDQYNIFGIFVDLLNRNSTQLSELIFRLLVIMLSHSKSVYTFLYNIFKKNQIIVFIRSPELNECIIALLMACIINGPPDSAHVFATQTCLLSTCTNLALDINNSKRIMEILDLITTILSRLPPEDYECQIPVPCEEPVELQDVLFQFTNLIRQVLMIPLNYQTYQVNHDMHKIFSSAFALYDYLLRGYRDSSFLQIIITPEFIGSFSIFFRIPNPDQQIPNYVKKEIFNAAVFSEALRLLNTILEVMPDHFCSLPVSMTIISGVISKSLWYLEEGISIFLRSLFVLSNCATFPQFADLIISNPDFSKIIEHYPKMKAFEKENLFFLILNLSTIVPEEVLKIENLDVIISDMFDMLNSYFDINYPYQLLTGVGILFQKDPQLIENTDVDSMNDGIDIIMEKEDENLKSIARDFSSTFLSQNS